MNVEMLRKALEGLPDQMEVIGECSTGQMEMLFAEVCTHEHGGLHYTEYDLEDNKFDPKCVSKLGKPTFRLSTIR